MKDKTTKLMSLPPIEYYFKQIQYPVTKQDLLKYAAQNNASDEIMQLLRQFHEREYESIVDILHEADAIN